jgi:hypothetical protein
MLEQVCSTLFQASTSIAEWSRQLRQSYFQDASIMTDETINYRSAVYSECVMYGSKVFPKTVSLVEGVKDMIESYAFDTFEDFAQDVEDFRQECLKHSKLALGVQRGHIFVLSNLKNLENGMQARLSVFRSNEAGSRTSAEDMRIRGEQLKRVGAIGMTVAAPIPVVNGAKAAVMLGAAAASIVGEHQIAKARERTAEAERFAYNAGLLQNLIGSLQEFSDAVNTVAKFVSLLELELRQMSTIGAGDEFKRLHFRKMKAKAEKLIAGCVAFLEIRPSIESDVRSVDQDLLPGYEEQWNRRAIEANQAQIEELDTN